MPKRETVKTLESTVDNSGTSVLRRAGIRNFMFMGNITFPPVHFHFQTSVIDVVGYIKYQHIRVTPLLACLSVLLINTLRNTKNAYKI